MCGDRAAETLRLKLSRTDPHRALMALLTYDEFALARYVATHEAELQTPTGSSSGSTPRVARASGRGSVVVSAHSDPRVTCGCSLTDFL